MRETAWTARHRLAVSLVVAFATAAVPTTFALSQQAVLEDEAAARVDALAESGRAAWSASLVDVADDMRLLRGLLPLLGPEFDALANVTGVVLGEDTVVERVFFVAPDGNATATLPAAAGAEAAPGAWAVVLEAARRERAPVVSPLVRLEGESMGYVVAIARADEGAGHIVAHVPLDTLVERMETLAEGADLEVEGRAVLDEGEPWRSERALALQGKRLVQLGEPATLVASLPEEAVAGGARTALWGTGVAVALLGAGAGIATARGIARTEHEADHRERLRRSEEHYRALFEDAGEMILVLARDGSLIDTNPQTTRSLGYARGEIKELTLFDIVAHEDHVKVARALDWPESDARPRTLAWTFLAREGHRVEAYGTLTVSSARANILVQAHLADVTRMKELERALRKANESLEARVDELDAFAHSVAHDLKNPVRAVAAFAAFIGEEERELSDDGRAHLDEIVRAAARMKSLIDAMLIYASAGGGQHPVEPVGVRGIIDEALRDLAPLVAERSARVAVTSHMPELIAQRAPLRQVFTNLVSNAIKHNPDEHPEVVIDAHPVSPDAWEFVVSDNGPGIPAEDAPHVFDLFRRGRTGATGSGVGLSIVARIVRQHGGEVWVEPRGAGGTNVRFTLSHPRALLPRAPPVDELPEQG